MSILNRLHRPDSAKSYVVYVTLLSIMTRVRNPGKFAGAGAARRNFQFCGAGAARRTKNFQFSGAARRGASRRAFNCHAAIENQIFFQRSLGYKIYMSGMALKWPGMAL